MNTCNTNGLSLQDLIERVPAPVDCTPVACGDAQAYMSSICWLTGCSHTEACALIQAGLDGDAALYVVQSSVDAFAGLSFYARKDLCSMYTTLGCMQAAGLLGKGYEVGSYGARRIIPRSEYAFPTGAHAFPEFDGLTVEAVDHRLTGELWARAQAALVLNTLTGVRELQNVGNPCGEIALWTFKT